ncbi:lipoprotein [Mesoplasma tabanidae]|nr:lipoprotein [Mesoplasma tabanidae]
MKKLITLIGATSLSVSPVMAVVSCKYIDTIQKSIDNKLAEVMASTSNYFKGAILANSEGYNGPSVDKYISKLKVKDMTNKVNDSSQMSKLFDTFFNTTQANTYMNNDVYSKAEFDNPVQENEMSKLINTLQKAYNEIYKLVGINFDPTLWNTALPLLLSSLSEKNILSVQKIMPKISKLLSIMKDVKVPNYKELIKMGIKTNQDLKIYFSYQLSLFAANLFDIKLDEEFDFNIEHEDINLDYYYYNSSVWTKIFKKINNKENNSKVSFTGESLALLINALFGINWYIQNFTTDEYDLNSEDMLDDNHIFSIDKTNLEVIADINKSQISEKIIDATNIDGLLQFFYDLFSGEPDKNSYKLLRTLKILFQVDDDITTGNKNLNFDKKVLKIESKTMDFKLGEWSSNGKKENGAMNTFLSSTLDGIIKAYTASFDPDGGIMDFLNKIGMGSEQLGGVASGVISSIFTGIDMDNFFATLIEQVKGSLNNALKWSFIKNNEKLVEQIKNIMIKAEELEPKILHLVNSEGSFTNKFLGYLVNTDIRKLMKILGLENSLPIELPKISLKQIIDIQITKEIKLSDILRLGTKGLSYLVALLGKGVAPKIVNIADAFNDVSLFLDDDFKIINGSSTPVKMTELFENNSNLIINDNGKEYTYVLALATKLSDKKNTGIKVTIPGGNGKNGLSKNRDLNSRQAAKWMMGLGVELENGQIDWNQFRAGTILSSISTLWNDETGKLITGILGGINDILKALADMFDDKQNKSYLEDLNYIHFNTKLISYTNFRNGKSDSQVTYNINYKNGSINNNYTVKLVLPGTKENENNAKYEILEFKLNK